MITDKGTVSLKVKRLKPCARLPKHATPGSVGLDLYACLDGIGKMNISSDPVLVPTGIAIELEQGYEAQIRPRSGLSSRGVMVAFGTVDSDYRGELFVTMYVVGRRSEHTLADGDRIAQLVLSTVVKSTVREVSELTSTTRGSGGHGSTGV